MKNCYCIIINAVIDNDNLPYFGTDVFSLTGVENTAYNAITFKGAELISGVLYSDSAATTVALNPGDRLGSSSYYLKSGNTVKLKGNYSDVTYVNVLLPTFACTLNQFAEYPNLTLLRLRFTGVTGSVEDYVKDWMTNTAQGAVILDISDTSCKFNNASTSKVFFIRKNPTTVEVLDNDDRITVLATYDIANDSWTYAS